jgi:glycerate 2-kinase
MSPQVVSFGSPIRVVVAPDKFKGSATATQAATAIARGVDEALGPGASRTIPVSDGGDGLLDCMIASGFQRVDARATGPVGDLIRTGFASKANMAVVELAQVSGLSQLPDGLTQPLTASSFGVGELIRAAMDHGCKRIILGLGGSACTDGGVGMATALGVRFLDSQDHAIAPGGGSLSDLASINVSSIDARIRTVEILVASDVSNPLLGPIGAARTYGPQKGASPAEVELLERGLRRLRDVARRDLGADCGDLQGAGAAGGAGFGAITFLGAKLVPGIDIVLETVGFREALAGVDLVVTGEGSLDAQSLFGKAPIGVLHEARRHGVPVAAIVGRNELSDAQWSEAGFAAVYSLSDLERDPSRCMTNAEQLLQHAGRILTHRLFGAGQLLVGD